MNPVIRATDLRGGVGVVVGVGGWGGAKYHTTLRGRMVPVNGESDGPKDPKYAPVGAMLN